ncbi:MAG: hypothetical protein IPK15_14375 [Verrucomicrobia bacterium]|nr:hypothetical protein [Verrucomicrobiota bacterium]
MACFAPDALGLEVANLPPTFEAGPDVEVNEDDLTQTYPEWARSISPGSSAEAAQSVRFEVTNKDSALFGVQPAIDANGTLSFTPARGAFGTVVVTVVAVDDGGTENGGFDESDPVDFLITIHPVNDAPVFEIHSSPVVKQDSGQVILSNWAHRIGPGSQFEVGQTFTFAVTHNAPQLFAVAPAIGADGTLTFAPAPGVSGEAQVTVVLHDSGGTERGGVDTAAPVNFTITIAPENRPPVAVVTTSDGCWLSTSPSNFVVIASSDGWASVSFDASPSFDEDGDALNYRWFVGGVLLTNSTDPKLSARFDLGEHIVTCLVEDGIGESVAAVQVEVIDASDAVEALSIEVNGLALHRGGRRVLQKSLQHSEWAFERGRWNAGLRQLLQFEHGARRLVPSRRRAEWLIQHSREIRDAVGSGRCAP